MKLGVAKRGLSPKKKDGYYFNVFYKCFFWGVFYFFFSKVFSRVLMAMDQKDATPDRR